MQASSVWTLGLRNLWRDLRAGELRLIIVAVLLAVAALTSVGFFADRLQGGLQRDARQLLGGDVVVVSDNPAPAIFTEHAHAQKLQTVATATFPTMARADLAQGGASRLVALKSVAAGYPLRGVLHLNQGPGQPDLEVRATPESGYVWVDAPLLEALGLKLGDRLLLGGPGRRLYELCAARDDQQ